MIYDKLTRAESIRLESFSLINAGSHHKPIEERLEETEKLVDYITNGKKEA